jgi:hypothetical protein
VNRRRSKGLRHTYVDRWSPLQIPIFPSDRHIANYRRTENAGPSKALVAYGETVRAIKAEIKKAEAAMLRCTSPSTLERLEAALYQLRLTRASEAMKTTAETGMPVLPTLDRQRVMRFFADVLDQGPDDSKAVPALPSTGSNFVALQIARSVDLLGPDTTAVGDEFFEVLERPEEDEAMRQKVHHSGYLQLLDKPTTPGSASADHGFRYRMGWGAAAVKLNIDHNDPVTEGGIEASPRYYKKHQVVGEWFPMLPTTRQPTDRKQLDMAHLVDLLLGFPRFACLANARETGKTVTYGGTIWHYAEDLAGRVDAGQALPDFRPNLVLTHFALLSDTVDQLHSFFGNGLNLLVSHGDKQLGSTWWKSATVMSKEETLEHLRYLDHMDPEVCPAPPRRLRIGKVPVPVPVPLLLISPPDCKDNRHQFIFDVP